MQPTEIMRATAALGDIGPAFYFTPESGEYAQQQFGIDGFRFYFLGRGGVLGDVEADVVRAAFGYFEPGLLAHMWNSGRERVAPRSPRDVARGFIECGHAFGRAKFAGLPGLDEFVAAAAEVIAVPEGAGLALFAGVRAEPVPADAPAAAMHQAMVLRELRGSAHLLAVAATGLATPLAHAIKRPGDVALFGYPADAAPEATDADRAKWERAEALTDELLAPAYAALSDDQAEALIAGTQAMRAALAS
ncbi:MAG TPA: hypothetical protein VNQ73_17850 [Ilumatobacter sp.]|nr:hypothetical protein [Ilumatobacter sp.]